MGGVLARLANLPAETGVGVHGVADAEAPQDGRLLRRVPVERFKLPAREAGQRVAVAQGVVDEGEREVLRQRDEPERELGEVHRHRVAVHAVQAAPRDQPPCVYKFVLAGRHVGRVAVRAPRLDEGGGKLAAHLHQEGSRAHCRIAHLQIQYLLGGGRAAVRAGQLG